MNSVSSVTPLNSNLILLIPEADPEAEAEEEPLNSNLILLILIIV